MKRTLDLNGCNGSIWIDVKIMTRASVFLPSEPSAAVEIRRGMIVQCKEGREAGRLAGVVVGPDNLQALCLILSHLPDQGGYQALPVSWITGVHEEVIFLRERFEMVLALPDWHSA